MALAPQTARVERDGEEIEVPIAQVRAGEIVIVRPGETIPVDGEVVTGQATVSQAAITGEAMPVEAGPAQPSLPPPRRRSESAHPHHQGRARHDLRPRHQPWSKRRRANRAGVQRLADRFSGYFLPLVVAVAIITFLVSRNPLAVAAVLVVACSCSLALATPIAMLASIGAAARRGLLIKGGKYLETLARADVVLVDKTGTLTLGRPAITGIIPLNGLTAEALPA